MDTNYYAMIMAGGIGSRFWPVSTTKFPKQFHDMLGTGSTLLQSTFKRLNGLIPEQNIRILTHKRYLNLVSKQLPQLHQNQILQEPAMRNTAPCILYAALKIKKENPNAIMVVAPSDHWIEDEEAFKKDLLRCFNICQKEDTLMTLGIRPDFPHTGYGYIQYKNSGDHPVKSVVAFTEKPDYETAKRFIAHGNYLWNAGIFIWSATDIINAFKKFQPDMYQLFDEGFERYNTDAEISFIQKNYEKAANISIDYAIMEQAANVEVLRASFDWNDLGSWGSLYDKLEKDSHKNVIIHSDVLAEETSGNIIHASKDKLVVIDGLKDYIIVDYEQVLLIYPKAKEQSLKKTLEKVKHTFGNTHL